MTVEVVKEEVEVRNVTDIIGEWGKWQRHFNIYCFLLWGASAINNMGYSFHAFRTDFWCSDVPNDYQNKSDKMKCFQFTNPNQSCTEWTYNTTDFKRSIISEFDLVCDRSNLASFTQSAFMIGYLFSGIAIGYLSDKYGRRPMIWISAVIEILALISCSVSVNILQYTISRLFLGMGSSGKGFTLYILLFESLGPKYRATISIISGLGWNLGYILVPFLAYWLRDFRYMQLSSVLFLSIMMVWFLAFDESIRWQITNGQKDKAEITLRKIIKQNGLSDENLKQKIIQVRDNLLKSTKVANTEKTYTILDLLKTKNLRKYQLIFWFNCPVLALIYYGFSFNMSDFGGNFYLTFFLSGMVGLPATLLTIIALKFMGRRTLFISFILMITISCLAVVPSDSSTFKVLFALLGKFAVGSAWTVFGTLEPEIHPTVLRSIGMGSDSVVGRIGSISAPFMTNLASNTSLTFVMVFYAILTTISAITALFLPETKGLELPDTVAQTEQLSDYELNICKSIKK